ncbi:conjugal transfer mating pair stabilization protein TraG [Enterobacter hormaechei]|jgi:conjugal transfer mating pair stabilization protein TraG|uniref:Conjugal transfer mating pair stabilization protein TraG n=9 Tax=Enterobacter TaxID=547 RepID=A0A0H3CUB4_ENTCC|nr:MULTISPECIES: conjugal transfer mating-pair stabilization protein TraG [Enterobacterales]ATZ71376.1 IncF plasmid conjugative transfer protein TraG [Enterobacter sp. HP19]EBF7542236.1 conjugal transfer protein TraG [Salmonella enterica]EBF7899979.1 conjugal transfer protein TraG [Salmonella enterica subsp. enterica serovar Worthington]ECL3879548.1 conjugal transfer protein TraG [Salmonella enterica subsp. enterica]EHE7828939.1 conjugal transfer mating pair stabilization protein TraG [Salmone
MLEIYTIYGGGMWKTALDAVVTLVGQNTFHTLMRIAGTFGVLAVLLTFIKQRNPMVFVQWLAIFMILTTILLVPKRSVQIIDLSDPAAVWKTDNVPVGLAAIASLTTSIGYKMASVYDMLMARPDSVTYSKTGMLFGSQIVAETSDFTTQNPELAQMLPDYVENCVIGDILLNGKYTINQLLNSTDPLTLITSNPSPLRGIFKMTSTSRQFLTCQQAATEIKTLANTDVNPGSATFTWLTRKVFGNKLNGASLLANAMGESYGFFYAGGMTAAQIMKNNITNSAVRQGIKGFAARSSDTANLLNLATENAATKQRLSWAAGNELATRTLPFAQSLLMLILVCLFPLMIALAASNHTMFGLNTLKIYISGFIYFQMWPVMFAILNYAANYWLQSQSGGTPLVLANKDVVALQHSDVANLAGYLSLSIPVLSFYLTKGAAAMGSQVAGSVLSSGAFTSAGVAATTADGNWSFNNMSMDNVSQNKLDTNLMQRQGQQTWQADNGSTQTQTAGGHTVIDGSGAMSNLPVNMKLSQLASSGFQESARQSQVQAQTALDGYNHSVTSGWSQLSQLSHQTGTSDSLTSGSENSQATNSTRGASMMMSAAESYAKANNISTQEAYNKLMDISNQGSVSAGIKGTAGGGLNLGVVKLGAEGSISGDLRHSTGSSRGIQNSDSHSQDMRHDQNSQAVNDFRQGMDMVKSSRITDGANHSENAASSNVQQLAATLNDAESQYHQYTTSSTQSSEFSRMATVAQNQSASLDTNYTQEFVDWAANKYGDKAQSMLTSAPSAREAAMEFVNERLKPEIMGDYQQGRSDLTSGQEHAAFSGEHVVQPAHGSQQGSGPTGNDGGIRYSPVESGAYNSNDTGNHHADGASQVTEYAGTYGGQVSSGGGSVSVRTGGSGSHESSLLAQNQTDSENLAGQREISHNEVHTDYGRQEQSSQIQSGTHRSEQDSLSIKSSGHDTGRHSTERQRSDSSAGMQQELRQSGTLREQGGAAGHGNDMSHSHATMNVEEPRVQGNAMQASFKENQAKLHEQSGQGFGPQNDIQRRVAEQRSENEHKINESAGEIDKKQSTVQASSDILKGENLIGQGRFKLGRAEAELDQSSKLNPFNDLQPDELQQRVAELRKKTGG